MTRPCGLSCLMSDSSAAAAATAAFAPADVDWNKLLAPYKGAQRGRSLFQLIPTAILFVAGWALMLASMKVGYWLTWLVGIPTTGLLTRLFIIQHDCGHGSFFRSARAN